MSAALKLLPDGAMDQLIAFKRDVEAALPGLVERVTLFGSRARGDAEHDSDYDVAIFLRGAADDRSVDDVVSKIAFDHMLEGVFISSITLPLDHLNAEPPTELAAEIARDGIVLR